MATKDTTQTGQDVNYHKRIAMGAALDGSSMAPKGEVKTSTTGKREGGLAKANKK